MSVTAESSDGAGLPAQAVEEARSAAAPPVSPCAAPPHSSSTRQAATQPSTAGGTGMQCPTPRVCFEGLPIIWWCRFFFDPCIPWQQNCSSWVLPESPARCSRLVNSTVGASNWRAALPRVHQAAVTGRLGSAVRSATALLGYQPLPASRAAWGRAGGATVVGSAARSAAASEREPPSPLSPPGSTVGELQGTPFGALCCLLLPCLPRAFSPIPVASRSAIHKRVGPGQEWRRGRSVVLLLLHSILIVIATLQTCRSG